MTAGRMIVPASASRAVWFNARYAGIGASEIAAVLGLSSAYGSAYDVFWTKVQQDADPDDDNESMYWGRELEAAIARRFARDHPEFKMRRTGLWQSRHRRWQLASPDRLLCEGNGRSPVAGWEAKTAGSWDGWGDPGTDDIPVHYRAQVLQQADVLGVDVVWLSLLVNGRSYREYVIECDAADLEVIRMAGDRFWNRVECAQDNPSSAAEYAPDVDAHEATTDRLKRMYDDVDDISVRIDDELIARRHDAYRDRKDAETRLAQADNELRDLMGNARWAHVGEGINATRVATRSVYPTRRVKVTDLRADHPELVATYERVDTTNKLTVPTPKTKEKIA